MPLVATGFRERGKESRARKPRRSRAHTGTIIAPEKARLEAIFRPTDTGENRKIVTWLTLTEQWSYGILGLVNRLSCSRVDDLWMVP